LLFCTVIVCVDTVTLTALLFKAQSAQVIGEEAARAVPFFECRNLCRKACEQCNKAQVKISCKDKRTLVYR
jgi:hypothetical protein